MFKVIGKFLFKIVGNRRVGKMARWTFWTVLSFWGPGPIIAWVGVEGLIAAAAITQSGILDYAGDKIVKR